MTNATTDNGSKVYSASYLKGQETRKANEHAKKLAALKDQTNPIFTALSVRLAKCQDHNLSNQVNQMNNIIKSTSNDLLNLGQVKLTQSDFDLIAQRISFVNDNGVGLDQVKTIEKIVRFIGAVALNQPSDLCNYLKVSALTTLKNDGSVTISEMVCGLSRAAYRISASTLRAGFENLAGYSILTGGSQASQARQVFNNFGFYTGFIKGAKDNKPVLTAYGETVLSGLVFKQSEAEQV